MPVLPDGRSYVAYNAANDLNGNKVCKVLFPDGSIEYLRDSRMPISGHRQWYRTLSGLYKSRVKTDKAPTREEEFVSKLGVLLAFAKPNFKYCQYIPCLEAPNASLESPVYPADVCGRPLVPGDSYVKAVCQNSYCYYINVTANSLAAIAEAVFTGLANK